MKNFTAEHARDLYTADEVELISVLESIKSVACTDRQLHIERHLKPHTLNSLQKRGFIVEKHSSIVIQKDSLYYTISW